VFQNWKIWHGNRKPKKLQNPKILNLNIIYSSGMLLFLLKYRNLIAWWVFTKESHWLVKPLSSHCANFCSAYCKFTNFLISCTLFVHSGGARPQNLGEHLRGKHIFWGGKIEFLKRYCYLPMPLSQDFCPRTFVPGLLSPPGDSPPSQKGAIFLGIPPPGDECPWNIAPPREANAPGISPPSL
jgi:hypothetical protein